MLSQELESDIPDTKTTPAEEDINNQESNKKDSCGEAVVASSVSANAITSGSGSGSTSDNVNGFRVRDVAEINQNLDNDQNHSEETVKVTVSNSSNENGAKRKLPNWMLTPAGSDVSQSQSQSQCKAGTDEVPNNKKSRLNDAAADDSTEAPANVQVDNDTSNEVDAGGECSTSTVTIEQSLKIKIETVKAEDQTNGTAVVADADGDSDALPCSSSSSIKVKPAVKVEKADASSTSRESCKFGIRCYRRNPMHRIEEAHPGDHDYKRPNYPLPPLGTPACPYGNLCYRRNPVHFEMYSHPPDTDFEKNYRSRLRRRRQQQNNLDNQQDIDSELDDYDLEDPFIDDGDDIDYIPSTEEDNEEELEDYDECDKAEE